MPVEDFLPQNWEEFDIWMQNISRQIDQLADKYGVTPAQIAALAADAAWVRYWVAAKSVAEHQEEQLQKYVAAIAKKEPGTPAPAEPTWELPPSPPAPVPPGIRRRARNLATYIKRDKAVYEIADGELLGIVGDERGETDTATLQPTLTARTLPAFAVEVEYEKQGKFLRIEMRYLTAGRGDWREIKVLTRSKGSFTVPPSVAGQGEQIELRAIYLENDQPVGNYSDIVTAFIAP